MIKHEQILKVFEPREMVYAGLTAFLNCEKYLCFNKSYEISGGISFFEGHS